MTEVLQFPEPLDEMLKPYEYLKTAISKNALTVLEELRVQAAREKNIEGFKQTLVALNEAAEYLILTLTFEMLKHTVTTIKSINDKVNFERAMNILKPDKDLSKDLQTKTMYERLAEVVGETNIQEIRSQFKHEFDVILGLQKPKEAA